MLRALRFSLCFLAAGCVQASVQRLDPAPRPARSPDSVLVLLEQPDRPYAVLAVVTTTSSTVFDSFDDLRRKLIAEAASLGGDALILGRESTTTTPIFNTVSFVQSERRKTVGEVIVFRDTRPPSGATPGP
jgi:hypothetical protein